MLSYQHGYHAGNLADLHKHRLLAQWLSRMVQDAESMTYIETHAGRGVYDLASLEAIKTGEAKAGIEQALKNQPISGDDPYLQVVAATKARYGASWYPGSPSIARQILRDQDMLHLFELHPQEFAALKARIRARNIRMYHKDGYQGALSLAKVGAGRGLVLIDPSYEVKREYDQAAEFIVALHAKWPSAAILLWYPILEAGLHESMIVRLNMAGFANTFHDEVLFAQDSGLRMKGSGLWGVK